MSGTFIPEDIYMHITSYGVTTRLVSNERLYQEILRIDPYFNMHDILSRLQVYTPILDRLRSHPWYDVYNTFRENLTLIQLQYDPVDIYIEPDDKDAIISAISGLEGINQITGTYPQGITLAGEKTVPLFDYIKTVVLWEQTHPINPLIVQKELVYFIAQDPTIMTKRVKVGTPLYDEQVYNEIRRLYPAFTLQSYYNEKMREIQTINTVLSEGVIAIYDIVKDNKNVAIHFNYGVPSIYSDNEDLYEVTERVVSVSKSFIDNGGQAVYTGSHPREMFLALIYLHQREYISLPEGAPNLWQQGDSVSFRYDMKQVRDMVYQQRELSYT